MNVSKYDYAGALQIAKHCKRNRPPEAKYGNSNIVQKYTYLNTDVPGFNTKLGAVKMKGFVKCLADWKPIAEKVSGRKLQKNAQLLVGAVVTLPAQYCCPEGIDRERWFTPERINRENEFFKVVLLFLRKKFSLVITLPNGETITNFCHAVVHRDESRSHFHVGFIPIVRETNRIQKKDRDTERTVTNKALTLSASAVINREVLSSLHTELDAFVKDRVSWYKGGILLTEEERANKLKNVSLAELKATPPGFRDSVLHPEASPDKKLKKAVKKKGRSRTD